MPYNDPDASKQTLPRQLYAALMGYCAVVVPLS